MAHHREHRQICGGVRVGVAIRQRRAVGVGEFAHPTGLLGAGKDRRDQLSRRAAVANLELIRGEMLDAHPLRERRDHVEQRPGDEDRLEAGLAEAGEERAGPVAQVRLVDVLSGMFAEPAQPVHVQAVEAGVQDLLERRPGHAIQGDQHR